MRIQRYACGLLLVASVAVAAVLLVGCETGGASASLTVDPSSVDLTGAATNSATFTFTVVASTNDTVTGLRPLSLPLTWTVSDPSLGSIVTSAGLSAGYVPTSLSGVNVITVRDQYGAEGVATVAQ